MDCEREEMSPLSCPVHSLNTNISKMDCPLWKGLVFRYSRDSLTSRMGDMGPHVLEERRDKNEFGCWLHIQNEPISVSLSRQSWATLHYLFLKPKCSLSNTILTKFTVFKILSGGWKWGRGRILGFFGTLKSTEPNHTPTLSIGA